MTIATTSLPSSAKPIAAAAKPAEPAINRVGRFHVLRELGRGSIGTVYLAHDPVIDRDVAIKTFSTKITLSERKKLGQQFINEARAAGRLSHPHIITIFDASSEGDTTYIAMEYLKGMELQRILAKEPTYSADDIATISWKIADALDYAHKNGVIHRDIKPANIFMLADNHPKLVDFGIARAPNRVADQLADLSDEPFTLFHNNLLGTPSYMSPEQATGKQVDARTDIYSLGAVMYEMLAGRKPFHSSDTDKLLQLIAYKAPKAPHHVNPKVPDELSHIVMRAMSKMPEKRYQSADDMAMDIKRFLVKGKRARKLIRMPYAEQKASAHPAGGRGGSGRLYWIGGVALIAAAAMMGLNFLR